MDVLIMSRKYKQCEGENVILGSVVSWLNLVSEKIVVNNVKKVVNMERLY